jgi:hypothetical protein
MYGASAGRFNCPSYEAPPKPTEVSKLNPANVDYVLAMGDSITAAFAIRATVFEGRDISWSIGEGTEDNVTFPYFIKNYNPELKGMSTKSVIPRGLQHLPHGDYHPKTDHLNVAESSGAVHRDSLEEQWAYIQE